MSNDDYNDDLTELAIPRENIEERTMPAKSVPAALRGMVEPEPEDDATVERSALNPADFNLDDATYERPLMEPPGANPNQITAPLKPPPRPAPPQPTRQPSPPRSDYEEDPTMLRPSVTNTASQLQRRPPKIGRPPREQTTKETEVQSAGPGDSGDFRTTQAPAVRGPRSGASQRQVTQEARLDALQSRVGGAAASHSQMTQPASLDAVHSRIDTAAPPPVAPPSNQVLAPSDTGEQLKRLGLTRRKRANANHVRPNSGFYSLPEANSIGTLDATVIGHVSFAEDNREAIALLIGLGLGLASALGLTTFALARWSTPNEVMGVGILLMIIGAIVTVGFVLPRENVRLMDIKGALVPTGINLALVLIAALCWQLGSIRSALRPFASEAATMSQRVLEDRSNAVAVDECVRLFDKLDARAFREVMVTSLVGRRDVASDCFARLDTKQQAQLSGLLANTWHEQLMTEGIDGGRACELADSLITLDRPTGDIETRLLACVLTAKSTNVQSCCGVSLVKRVATANENWVASIQAGDELDASDESTAAGLMTLAFHQQGVTGSQQEFVNAAKFDGAAGRRLALTFACDSLQGGAERLSMHFAASLGKQCPINEATVPRSREIWADVCEEALSRVGNAVEPSKALCAATRTALVGHAVADASRIVQQASKDRSKNRDLAIAIDVEANMTRGSLDSGFRTLESWGKKRRAENEAAENKPTFKPDW